jgi:N-acetylglucosaminyldiphosphoundecaprenol N-acetyl-beta-D-mannosaminyltransferase
LICLWWVRRRANIAYEAESVSDGEYVESQSLKGDIGIALRAIPAILYGEGVPTSPESVTLLGIPVNNVTMTEAIDWMVERMSGELPPAQVAFVNADCANIAYKNEEYRTVLESSDFVLADGIGMKLAGKLLRQEIKQNVNGTDLFPRLCAALEGTGRGIYFLGAQPGVVDRVAEWVQNNYPNVTISGTQHGYYENDEESAVIEKIRASGAGMIMIAFGAPRQDLWVARHLSEMGVPVAMGVGGLFDFYSGNKPRAPQWVREIGMEWVFRLAVEPQRLWKRYVVGNVIFLSRVIRERVSRNDKGCGREGVR